MDYPLFKRCSSTDSLFISYATNCFKIFRYISTGIWYSADTRKFMGSDPINGDHTYGVDDENMSNVSVEGITNTGDKLDKDHTTIS